MWQSPRPGGAAASYAIGAAAALTAVAATLLLDPNSGRRRRALLRDQFDHIGRASRDFLDKAQRDARHRTEGVYREAAARLRAETPDDQILEQRVRAELGRVCSHPRSIEVQCREGVAHLQGVVLEAEVDAILRGVRRVRGVTDVRDALQRHAAPGRIPSLQGEPARRPQHRLEYLQANWSPAPRLLASATGAALAASGLLQRSAFGYAMAACGAALLVRGVANRPLAQLFGARAAEGEGVLVQKSIEVYAEPDEAYSCWRDLERLPHFMSHVREVRRIDDVRYHWIVDGLAGSTVEWDAQITADVPNELIAWRTVADSTVHSSGFVHFEPTPYGGTRVQVRMSYRPPANALGHSVAKLFARDPRRQMDADLARFKHYVEMGRLTPGAEDVRH